MAKSTTIIVAGAITWTEEADGYLIVTITDARSKRHACEITLGTPLAKAIASARDNNDGVAVTVLHHGIDLDNVHTRQPSREGVAMEVTWRAPRIGDSGAWGWIDRGNVVPLVETAPTAAPAKALPLAA